ncbi:hypothetical protein [Thermostichus vulcanus]|uniref:Uncharacterized protein n=1 Tax=Thermostichus vulcanus str. 'Rupite' TaxID=2813851 RepID=A0ABT0CD86_THEVL|nr:hypothetical protein [Thermostichus vulcanus]MCJ2543755.1 hypothetical protein [Thermostichus vulcanus str. 'Rupite']
MNEAKTMTVQQIIQSAMMTGLLTSAQEHELNVMLFKDECSEADLFLLRRLHRCLRQGSIRQIETLNNTVAIGHFGSPLRLVPDPTARVVATQRLSDSGTESLETQAQPLAQGLSLVRNPKVG